MNRLIKSLPLFAVLMAPVCSAKTSDADEPIHIEADSVEILEQQGVSIYRGHVNIRKGSMLIKGELIHIHQQDQGIDRILVTGDPASFRQLNDQGEEVSAQSLEMTYTAGNGILVMKKDAILVQSGNRFTSQHIVYDTRRDTVQAGKDESTSEPGEKPRVTITIQPQKESATTEQNNNQ
jgi:lipopolysaccharide export system protein LptA